MSLEDDILNNEFSGNEGRVIDAEVVFNRPKKSRKLMYSLLLVGLLASIGVGSFLLMKPSVLINAAPLVQTPKPLVSIPPKDLLGGANGKAAGLIKPSEPVVVAPAFTSSANVNPLDVKADVVAGPLDVKQLEVKPMDVKQTTATNVVAAPALSAVAVKPETLPVAKPVDVPVKMLAPVADAPAVSPDKFDALEQKVRDLAVALGAISKKIDMLVSENKVEPSKARAASKAVVSVKVVSVKQEVVANMKDLHITALLSDGVMFDGDVPVLIGQFSKQLNGRIVSINAEQNVVITDSKIYKVQ